MSWLMQSCAVKCLTKSGIFEMFRHEIILAILTSPRTNLFREARQSRSLCIEHRILLRAQLFVGVNENRNVVTSFLDDPIRFKRKRKDKTGE